MRTIPEVPGVMTAGQVLATAQSIAAHSSPAMPCCPGTTGTAVGPLG